MRWLSRQNQIHDLKDPECEENIENEIVSINQGWIFY